MDYREVYPAVRAYLGRKKLAIGKQDPSSWVKRGIELIRVVWGQTQFLSGKEWQRRPAALAEFVGARPMATLHPEPDSGLLTETDWQAELPDDGELTAWLEELAALPSRRLPRLLACRIVAYRWGLNLSPESVFDKIRAAAERTGW